MLKTKAVTTAYEIEEITAMMTSSFPEEEQTAIAELRQLTRQSYVNFNAHYYDSELCGFSFTVRDRNFILLLYLVVKQNFRSSGIGTQIIKSIIHDKGGHVLILNVEPLDGNAANYTQRKRRYNFYMRNGLTDTGCYLLHEGVEYLILASQRQIDAEKYKKLLSVLSQEYSNCKIYKK